MRQILIAAAAVAMLASCAGPTPDEIAAADHSTCTEYGFTAHPEYGQCRLALDQMRMQARQAQASNAFAAAAQLGAMQQRYQSQYATTLAPPAPPVTCTRAGTASFMCY